MGVIRIRGSQHRGSRELTDGNVIRMTVCAAGIEGDNNMWLNAPNVFNDFCYHLRRVGLIEITINVIKKFHFVDAQFLYGVEEFRLAHSAERFQAWIVLFIAEPAALAARSSDQISLYTLRGIFRKRATHAKRFVIGVSKNTHQSQWLLHSNLLDQTRGLILARRMTGKFSGYGREIKIPPARSLVAKNHQLDDLRALYDITVPTSRMTASR